MTSETVSGVAGPRHRALYRRFRAQTFSQIVGQGAPVETLRNAVRLGRLGHGFLFVGPRGTGKTSMARILAKAVNCLDPRDGEPCDACEPCAAIREGRALDVVELDAASNNRVDDMRELLPRVYTAPADLRRKVFIIDEVQRIKEGWDVLLKTLEEPPDGVLFIFCTTDPGQIRPAVVSRLQRFTFRPLTPAEIAGKLERILASEERHAEPEAIALIARLAAGGMRDAESMLDQVLAGEADPITATVVGDLLGVADATLVDGFIDALAGGDPLAGIAVLERLEADGRDLAGFADQVVVRLRERIVAALGPGAAENGPALIAAARRLTGVDGGRGAPGGERWQLELALLSATDPSSASRPPQPAATPARGTPPPAAAPPAPAAEPPPPVRMPPVSPPPAASAPAAEPSAPAPRAAVAPAPAAAAPAPPPAPPPAPAPESAPSPSTPPPLAAAPAPSPAASPAPSAGDPALGALLERWPEIVAHVGRNPANRPIVSACRPVEIRDGVLILGFPEQQPFLRDHAERRKSAIEEGILAVLGRPLGVRCVVANLELPEPEGADPDLIAHARRIFEGDLVDPAEIG